MTGKAKKEKGIETAKILQSRKAFRKFQQIIKAQQGNLSSSKLKLAKFSQEIKAEKMVKL